MQVAALLASRTVQPVDLTPPSALSSPQPVLGVGLGPLAQSDLPVGLRAPSGGVSAARPFVQAAASDASLLDEARAHFTRQRAEVVAAFQRTHPELAQTVVNELADEWVARSMRRYGALLDQRNDGIQELTPSGLLLTIAYESRRASDDPVQVLANAHQAKVIEQFTRGSSAEEAAFQVHTVGARLSRSTAGWEAELRR